MKYPIFYIALFSCTSNILSLKLLLIFPAPAKSHYFLGNALAKGLANSGHEVTLIAPFSEKDPPKNFNEIVISEMLDIAEQRKKLNMFEMGNVSPILQLIFMSSMLNSMSEKFFQIPKIQELLKSKEHFDAVILEQFWNDGIKIFAHHFNAPLIVFSTMGSNRWTNNLVANPEPPSYIPDVLLNFAVDMTFWERMYNFIFGILSDLQLYWYLYPMQNALIKKYYPNAPNLDQILYNVSLVLLNSHESISQPVPRVPNMIDIGGFHVNPPKELPKDLKKFMDDAKNGVIYFSLGSNIMPSQMPKEKRDAFLKVLGSRKEKVLWKWDEEILENKPNNMMVSKWFPQQAILAHPNCKLFITHGGMLSTTETVYLGVPVLAIPLYADQKLNAGRAVSLGFGKSLPFFELNQNNLAEAVNELLSNPSYSENAKMRSRIMHDRQMKPIDLANYWIEYVVRHKGAPHLRVAGVNLPLYKYYMLDVLGVLLSGWLLTIYLLSRIYRWVKSKKSKAKEPKKKRE